jgi:hypothetical protein
LSLSVSLSLARAITAELILLIAVLNGDRLHEIGLAHELHSDVLNLQCVRFFFSPKHVKLSGVCGPLLFYIKAL